MKTNVWCETEDVHLDALGFARKIDEYGHYILRGLKYPKKVRCPKCGKQFETFTRECHDPGCIHLYLPKHKAPVKRPRKETRDDKGRRKRRTA